MLGVTFSRKFSVSQYVDSLLAACYQSLFALWTPRQHGLPDDTLNEVFQAVVINKLTHASPAWWGFASGDDRHRLEAFLRKSAKLGYRAERLTTFASICDDANCKLFTRITGKTQHLLYPLFPLNASITTLSLFVNAVTTFNFLIVHPFSETKTLLRNCCIVMLLLTVLFLFFSSYSLCNSILYVILLKLEWMNQFDNDVGCQCHQQMTTRLVYKMQELSNMPSNNFMSLSTENY